MGFPGPPAPFADTPALAALNTSLPLTLTHSNPLKFALFTANATRPLDTSTTSPFSFTTTGLATLALPANP